MSYEIKNIDGGGVLDVDDKSRRVKVVLNKTGVKDFDEDIIEKNAFNATLKERGPKGSNLIWHLTDHRPSLKDAVGKFSELSMKGDDLVGVTDIPETTWGNDVLEFYKLGTINQHSIGFSTIKREVVNDNDPKSRYTIIKEVKLYEGSAVLWGANEFTPTLSVGKSLTKEELIGEYKKSLNDLDTMHKMFKSGHLSDQSYELIEMKINQLTSRLQQLFEETTQLAQKAVEPEKNGLLDVLTTFNNDLKRQHYGRETIKGAA
jgi:HK97 family phage prohead protease